jgi:hypothetical protein
MSRGTARQEEAEVEAREESCRQREDVIGKGMPLTRIICQVYQRVEIELETGGVEMQWN